VIAQRKLLEWPAAPTGSASSRTIVASYPHCFNTIANEYPQLGGSYEVIHHTQPLAAWSRRASSLR